jgi:hypothetical protein
MLWNFKDAISVCLCSGKDGSIALVLSIFLQKALSRPGAPGPSFKSASVSALQHRTRRLGRAAGGPGMIALQRHKERNCQAPPLTHPRTVGLSYLYERTWFHVRLGESIPRHPGPLSAGRRRTRALPEPFRRKSDSAKAVVSPRSERERHQSLVNVPRPYHTQLNLAPLCHHGAAMSPLAGLPPLRLRFGALSHGNGRTGPGCEIQPHSFHPSSQRPESSISDDRGRLLKWTFFLMD